MIQNIKLFTISDSTGAAVDPDGTPTATLYINGVANAAVVTVEAVSGKTGCCKASFTRPALQTDDVGSLLIEATIGGVEAKKFLELGTVTPKQISRWG